MLLILPDSFVLEGENTRFVHPLTKEANDLGFVAQMCTGRNQTMGN
jgi:hypothetical protein